MRRLATCAAAVLALTVPRADAAPRPHITDVAGDVTTKEAGYDIRAVTFSTVKEGRTAVALRIRMTLEQVPTQGAAHHYTVTGIVDDECRLNAFANYNEAEYAGWQLFCNGRQPAYLNLPTVVEGKDLVWTFRFTQIPRQVRPGMLITDLAASTGIQEVWTGGSLLKIDTAASTATYRIG